MKLLCATANGHKLGEIQAIMADLPVKLLSLTDFPEVVLPSEDGASYADNALIKARAAFWATNLPSFADDTGLEVETLDGAPGLFSNRYADDDPARRRKLLNALRDLPPEKRDASFICTIGFVWEGGERTFTRQVRGRIALIEQGKGGFGYDPLFLLPELGRTYAEMGPQEKNRLSHRALALFAFREWLLVDSPLAPLLK